MSNLLTIEAVAAQIERVLDEADQLDRVLVAAAPVAEQVPGELDLLAAEITRQLDAAEQSIALLDAADDDPDRENDDAGGPGDDDNEDGGDGEPSLGSIGSYDQRFWSSGYDDDREDEHDGAEPEDPEPGLGAFDRLLDQTKSWRTHSNSYFPDSEMDPSEREPALGSLHGTDQTHWAGGDTRDRELDEPEDSI